MEITNERKAKVFAQYLGQKLTLTKAGESENLILDTHRLHYGTEFNKFGETKLILKPLSKITDEDAIEVAKMMGYDDLKTVVRDGVGNFLFICQKTKGKNKIFADGPTIDLLESKQLWWDENNGSDGHSSEGGEVSLACYQFLQSKGYDLPQYLLGGKTLHQAGLAIYE